MDHKENPNQPESGLSEEQLDLLLEQFLAEEFTDEDSTQTPVVDTPLVEETAVMSEDTPAAAESPDISEEVMAEQEISEASEAAAEDREAATVPEATAEDAEAVEIPEATAEDTEAAAVPAATAEDTEAAAVPAATAEDTEAPIGEAAPADDEMTTPQESFWEDQPVETPALAEEIGPDESAIAGTGLTHPEDLDFEKIMEETLREAAEEEAEKAPSKEDEEEEDFSLPDEYFLPVEKSQDDDTMPHENPEYKQTDFTEMLIRQQAEMEHTLAEESEDSQAPEAYEEEEEESAEDDPPRKRRPKNTGTYGFFGIPHMITTAIWLALILFIGAGLGRMIWQVAADMLAFGRPNQVVTITITSNDDLDSIAQKLYDTGLIEYPGIFKFYGQLSNAEKKVKPGTYELNTIYDYMALVKNMAGTADRVDTTVVIPEGYTCAQIFRLLEKSGVCTVEAMEEAVMNADLSKYWFLEGIDQSDPNCLEGFLFPDTYKFYLDHDPNSVLTRLLDTFDKRFSDAMREKLDLLNDHLAEMMRSHGLSESYIQSHLFTVKEVVIVASIIERETAGDEESYYISSVIYNRLTNPGEYPYLNMDSTLVYITGHSTLTAEDLKIDSPYNTYLYKGLIPGAISNPGLASLNAALSPESTDYYYFAYDPNAGQHKFFKTYKAHQAFMESLKNGG